MKSVILFKMRLWVFLTELPLMALLLVAWRVNGMMEDLIGLWPLMIALMALIIFLAFYFFRLVEISWEEIHDIGLFTRRDSSVINEGKSLSLLLTPKGVVRLALLGPVGEEALYDWTSETDAKSEIALYRGNAYGGERAVRRLLGYFGADEGDLDAILADGDFKRSYKYSAVTARQADEGREIRIDINETLLANGTPLKKEAEQEPLPTEDK